MKIFFHTISKAILLSVILIAVSCIQDDADEIFFLRHKGADMPVWVRGNVQSNVFIIFLHGGPGGSSYPEAVGRVFESTEKEFAMVYWDQRGSGMSQGKSKTSMLTSGQFEEDLDLLIGLLEHKYKNPQIFLMGHSWGGLFGAKYLINAQPRPSLKGWIEVNGAHNLSQRAFNLSENFVLNFAAEKLSGSISKKDRRFWEEALSFYEKTDNWNIENISDHSEFVSAANGYLFDPDHKFVTFKDILFSEGDFIALLKQNSHVGKNLNIWGLDYTKSLYKIQIPTLLMWGKHDGILPIQLGEEAKAAYGLEEENFIVFDKSAHSPQFEEPELFNRELIRFVKSVLY